MPNNRQPKILILAGSTRTGSLNQQLADAYVAELATRDCEITRITLADFPLPIINEDLEAEKGIPENAEKLARLFDAHDAIVIVGPEYNGSLTPLLKNTIDWVSRLIPESKGPWKPFKGKICAIASASAGVFGGISSITHLRQILTRLGMLVISEQFALGNADTAFDDMGRLSRERDRPLFKEACASLIEKATLLG